MSQMGKLRLRLFQGLRARAWWRASREATPVHVARPPTPAPQPLPGDVGAKRGQGATALASGRTREHIAM